jgi:glucose dehydrogenase
LGADERRSRIGLRLSSGRNTNGCSAAVLLDVRIDGRPRKIVAQVTKQGFTYVFDRVNYGTL